MKPPLTRGNWTDQPCFYVNAVDGNRMVLLAGPFRTLDEAEAIKPRAVNLAMNYGDPKAHWYAYGCCKMPNGYREGAFNKQLGV